jgi:hypothetical protein
VLQGLSACRPEQLLQLPVLKDFLYDLEEIAGPMGKLYKGMASGVTGISCQAIPCSITWTCIQGIPTISHVNLLRVYVWQSLDSMLRYAAGHEICRSVQTSERLLM